jgi:hypothetical protein
MVMIPVLRPAKRRPGLSEKSSTATSAPHNQSVERAEAPMPTV